MLNGVRDSDEEIAILNWPELCPDFLSFYS